jgi:hypothetical protein
MGKSKIIGLCIGCLFSVSVSAQIVSEGLSEISNGTIGVKTAFQSDVWGQNPDAADVLRQINEAATENLDEAERIVLRQVLLTDVAGVPSLEKENQPYLTARLKTMMAQGFYEDILTLLDEIPEKQLSEELKLYRLKAVFALGRETRVCAEENMALFQEKEVAMRVICADLLKEPFEASMSYEVYRDSGRDSEVFLNASGDKIYRHLDGDMPAGKPTFWEWTMVAKAFGLEVFQRDLTRGELVLLAESDYVPEDVREEARKRLMNPKVEKNPDGKILDDLMKMSKQRREIEKNLPPDMLRKLMGKVDDE